MPCTKQTTKKYTTRKSPPYPANKCRIGQRKQGNDGQWYVVSKPNVSGVKRWTKATKKSASKKTQCKGNPAKRFKLYMERYKKNVVVTGYLKKPKGKIIHYDRLYQEFVKIHRDSAGYFGNRLDPRWLRELIKEGYKVWVVPHIRIQYDT